MSRKNYFGLAEQMYQLNPHIRDFVVQYVFRAIVNSEPTLKTIAVWKSRLRKKGVAIPDERKKEAHEESQMC